MFSPLLWVWTNTTVPFPTNIPKVTRTSRKRGRDDPAKIWRGSRTSPKVPRRSREGLETISRSSAKVPRRLRRLRRTREGPGMLPQNYTSPRLQKQIFVGSAAAPQTPLHPRGLRPPDPCIIGVGPPDPCTWDVSPQTSILGSCALWPLPLGC